MDYVSGVAFQGVFSRWYFTITHSLLDSTNYLTFLSYLHLVMLYSELFLHANSSSLRSWLALNILFSLTKQVALSVMLLFLFLLFLRLLSWRTCQLQYIDQVQKIMSIIKAHFLSEMLPKPAIIPLMCSNHCPNLPLCKLTCGYFQCLEPVPVTLNASPQVFLSSLIRITWWEIP